MSSANANPSPLAKTVAVVRRPSVKALIPFALWALFILWMVTDLFGTGGMAFKNATQNLDVGHYNVGLAPLLFLLDFWGLAAGLVVGLIVVNPFAWLNGKRLAFGGIALGIMLGRFVGGFVAGLLPAVQTPNLALFLTAPVALMIAGIVVIFVVGLLLGALFAIFVGVPVVLFNQIFQFERSLKIFSYQADGLAWYIVRFVFWLRNQPLPKPGPDDSKGARFATIEEIQQLHAPDSLKAMAFGHIGEPLFIETDKHVLIMASTRSGKGVTLIIPHLLRYRGSAFVLDPKGENAKATGRTRAKLNDKVHYLDPFGISGMPRSRFNPLARFTPENMEAESKALAAALFVVADREHDHWTDAGQQLLAAIILYVFVSADIPKDKKDLPTVRKVLLGGLKDALDAMMLIDDGDGLLRDLAVSFKETPEKEFGSILSTAQRQTQILDNPFMTACLAATGKGEEVDFKAWRAGTMTVYLCLSAPKFPTFNRWLRLVLTSALDEMTDTLDPPRLPVCFMLDELATLGHLTTVENAVGLAAGYGIQLVSVFQDVAQMRDLYKGRWASFIGNAGVRALFNLEDYDTAKYWSDFTGSNLVESRNMQQDIYGYGTSQNVGEAMRPLLSPEKLMFDYASGKMLVLVTGAHPIETDRISYWNDASLTGLWDDPRKPIRVGPAFYEPPPPYKPPPAPPSGPSAPPSPPPGTPPRPGPPGAPPAAPPVAAATTPRAREPRSWDDLPERVENERRPSARPGPPPQQPAEPRPPDGDWRSADNARLRRTSFSNPQPPSGSAPPPVPPRGTADRLIIGPGRPPRGKDDDDRER
jgi:type IV secretion system protein VirD4